MIIKLLKVLPLPYYLYSNLNLLECSNCNCQLTSSLTVVVTHFVHWSFNLSKKWNFDSFVAWFYSDVFIFDMYRRENAVNRKCAPSEMEKITIQNRQNIIFLEFNDVGIVGKVLT